MSIDLTNHEVAACRAVGKLLTLFTAGWAEAEHADHSIDCGEWSGSPWSDQWQQADEHCIKVVAERFGLEDHQLQNCIHEYDSEFQYRWWKAVTPIEERPFPSREMTLAGELL